MTTSTHDPVTSPAVHVAVWIDHKEARIFHVRRDETKEITVSAPLHNIHHKHAEGQGHQKAHPDDAKRYFHEVAHALEGAKEILVVGPSTAKLELIRHVHKHHAALEACIVGVETVDHPTDKQLVAFAKDYFLRVDQMR